MEKFLNMPLSANQQRLWIISQQEKNNPSYNIQLAYYFEGEINISIFRKSIKLLFDRQHTLFSVFKQKDGVPYINLIKSPVEVKFFDYTGIDSGYEKILSFAGNDSRIPFDLENGPLFRIYLLKEGEKRYFFCLTIHHIIFDGFSRRLFVEELNRIYNNLANDINEEIEPLISHSYDFSKLEKNAIAEDEIKYIEYWKATLKECHTELNIPPDFKRKIHTGLGGRLTFQIPKEESKKLIALSHKTKTSVFKMLLSVVAIFLNKCTGEDDICIGIPVMNRKSALSMKIFGFFVNTVPVRFSINEMNSFNKQIEETDLAAKNAILNSNLSFDKIVNAVKPERVPGVNPFYQVSFSWINGFTQPLNFCGVKGQRITVPDGVSSSDLTFYMWENGDFIEGYMEYNSDIYNIETIKGLRDNFLVLVDNLVEDPHKPLKLISMISAEEIKLIESFNKTATYYPVDKTISQLFEEQVLLNPGKKAVVYKETSLSYMELNEKSNQLARYLRNSGVTTNDNIGLMLDKSVNMIVGIMGIIKAGAAYVPIDPGYPTQRKRFIISDSGSRILLTEDKYLNEFDFSEDTVHATSLPVKISLDSPDLSEYDTANVEINYTSDDIAYVIYTSGTSGAPKGTLIPHKGVVRLVRNTNCINVKPEDSVLQAQSFVFDASTVEIFGALLNGATLIVIDKTTLLDQSELRDVFLKEKISVAAFSSTLFAHIAEVNPEIFRELKYLQVGGDVLSAPHANKIRKINPELRLLNVYGPTENSCISTYYDIDRDHESSVPIGKPISNSTAYIFDKNMNYQPLGIIGELYVGGDGLSKGYLNRDDLNRTSFIDHPFHPGERLYKTGDMARWLRDGNIEFHGRIDSQVKIRGFRIELKEIETALTEVEGVCEAFVKAVNISADDKRLVAFLKVIDGTSIDFKKVSDHIRSKMPSYMVPSAYRTLAVFPMTINGKIDSKALNIDLSQTGEEDKIISREMTLTEQKITRIWQDIIKTNSISIYDNFFDVGGSSLLAILAVDRLEKEFNIKLGLRVFFDCPKIQYMAEYIDSKISIIKNQTFDNQVIDTSRIISGEI